ncbi:GNAT family N-acetyltransferase [Paenibacillus allorhizosphaerae]|uniref:N-acetyltransferase domain-containing protein n=1 Tax=Paenibacillus allorhizosphaerae TaxID=2849866 RepID=A0ABM8VIN5_9BACL|nr:GNAT family N-acetyltransferase [Paenibacillus allorhizosphaerae]CAG7644383.1 putative protein YqjY [Paenibacillus allorhizosphaerae]
MIIRHMEPEDCGAIISAAPDWWGSTYASDMFSSWYIHHFRETCLVAEQGGDMIGFLMGFLSQTVPDEAYIRIVMVDPVARGQGVGRALYGNFFDRAAASGRTTIRCVTVPRKKDSIAFHTKLGFSIEPQEQELEGVPVCLNYDGRGGNRVMFKKLLVR